MATIAWIGLGHMGGPMSGNLVAAGHRVTPLGIAQDGGVPQAGTTDGPGSGGMYL